MKKKIILPLMSLLFAFSLSGCADLKTADEVESKITKATSNQQTSKTDSKTSNTAPADKNEKLTEAKLTEILTKNAEAMSKLDSYKVNKTYTVKGDQGSLKKKVFNEEVNLKNKEFHGKYEGGSSEGTIKEDYAKGEDYYALIGDTWSKTALSEGDSPFNYRFTMLTSFEKADDFKLTVQENGNMEIRTVNKDAKYNISAVKFNKANAALSSISEENRNDYLGELVIVLDKDYRTVSIKTTPKTDKDTYIDAKYSELNALKPIEIPSEALGN